MIGGKAPPCPTTTSLAPFPSYFFKELYLYELQLTPQLCQDGRRPTEGGGLYNHVSKTQKCGSTEEFHHPDGVHHSDSSCLTCQLGAPHSYL